MRPFGGRSWRSARDPAESIWSRSGVAPLSRHAGRPEAGRPDRAGPYPELRQEGSDDPLRLSHPHSRCRNVGSGAVRRRGSRQDLQRGADRPHRGALPGSAPGHEGRPQATRGTWRRDHRGLREEETRPRKTNGWGGIRTHETLLEPTRSPGVRLKPLGHPSNPGCQTPSCQWPVVTSCQRFGTRPVVSTGNWSELRTLASGNHCELGVWQLACNLRTAFRPLPRRTG